MAFKSQTEYLLGKNSSHLKIKCFTWTSMFDPATIAQKNTIFYFNFENS